MRKKLLIRIFTTVAALLFCASSANANPWSELTFPRYFWQQDETILPISQNPAIAPKNPWDNLGFPLDCCSTPPSEGPIGLSEFILQKIRYKHQYLPRSISFRPYRRGVILALAKHWKSPHSDTLPIILITLTRRGSFVRVELFQSSGSDVLDKAALYAAAIADYPPLPNWTDPEDITFKMNLSSVQAVKEGETSWDR